MIPYEKITKIQLPITIESGAVDAAGALDMKENVRSKFGPTISRVIVFDARQPAIYVLRQKLDDEGAAKVSDYLALKQNAADAKNFRMLPPSATLGDGRRTLQLYKTLDLFITDDGDAGEAVTGWVPDDKVHDAARAGCWTRPSAFSRPMASSFAKRHHLGADALEPGHDPTFVEKRSCYPRFNCGRRSPQRCISLKGRTKAPNKAGMRNARGQ